MQINFSAHDWKDLVETASIIGGIVWGFIKFTSKFTMLDEIPRKIDELSDKVDTIDNKVENLTGQFEVYKSFGKR